MFATRTHNENAIYEQQTAAAAKPLNQGVKGLAPKTPGAKAPKTPFKVPLNNENAVFPIGKTGGKGKEGGLFAKGEHRKADPSAFQTPAGPRNRAPLGNKTTNVKATAFRTPAPGGSQEKPLSAKPTSPRLRRAKVKIHQAEVDPLEDANGEREIEYMPPRGEPLPDLPDDWDHERRYPQFEGKNLTRGWWEEAQPNKGDPEDFSDFEEKIKKIEERERKKARTLANAQRAPTTLSSRRAASALSKPSTGRSQGGVPSFAAPTATTKARLPSAMASRKTVTAQGNPRHTAAKVASNSTLGYTKGRVVSGAARAPRSTYEGNNAALEKKEMVKQSAPNGSTALDELFGMGGLKIGEDDGEDDDLLGGNVIDEEFEDFELPLLDS